MDESGPVDVVALGNMCVDILLPPADPIPVWPVQAVVVVVVVFRTQCLLCALNSPLEPATPVRALNLNAIEPHKSEDPVSILCFHLLPFHLCSQKNDAPRSIGATYGWDAATLTTAEYLDELTASAPPEPSWEVGGNCNFLIAASRIGLRAECVGHVGEDDPGEFLRRVLKEEGVPLRRLASADSVAGRLPTIDSFSPGLNKLGSRLNAKPPLKNVVKAFSVSRGEIHTPQRVEECFVTRAASYYKCVPVQHCARVCASLLGGESSRGDDEDAAVLCLHGR